MLFRSKDLKDARVVINGAGAAATAIVKLLIVCGLSDVVLCDRSGAIYAGRPGLNDAKLELAELTNRRMVTGSLADAIVGADVLSVFRRPIH